MVKMHWFFRCKIPSDKEKNVGIYRERSSKASVLSQPIRPILVERFDAANSYRIGILL